MEKPMKDQWKDFFCTKHQLYHGQKYPSCVERKDVKFVKALNEATTPKDQWTAVDERLRKIIKDNTSSDGQGYGFDGEEEVIEAVHSELEKVRQETIEEVIEYISNNQGWEESGDLYRKHYGLPIKYPKK